MEARLTSRFRRRSLKRSRSSRGAPEAIANPPADGLKRDSDGMFNAKTGRYDGISSAYRMKLVPAFIVDPGKPMDIPARDNDERGRRKAFDDAGAAMIKAVDTLVPREVPPRPGANWRQSTALK